MWSASSGRHFDSPAFTTKDYDILVLGAGLAGLRAAWAAKEENPAARVAVVGRKKGPSGSSFANANNMLGMQVCFTDRDVEAFTRRVMELASPGRVDEALVRAMAHESMDRFIDLDDAGLSFRRDGSERLQLMPGCFDPDGRRAVVFDDLAGAHAAMAAKAKALGCDFVAGHTVRALIQVEGAVQGCLLQDESGGHLALTAPATVFALGGAAPLYARHQAGPGNPGYSLGLLAGAGAAMANTGYMQIMWASRPGQRYWPAQNLGQPGSKLRTAHGEVIAAPEELGLFAAQRATHCPVGHGTEDAVLDAFLAEHLHPEGYAEVYTPKGGWSRVTPTAHAGNGGALIDANGRTSVPGLYACGECATGMHGANRIGGAMVLATQVFGQRAGAHAARPGPKIPRVAPRCVRAAVKELLAESENPARHKEQRSRIAAMLQETLLGARPSRRHAVAAALQGMRLYAADWRVKLEALTGLAILEEAAPAQGRADAA